jgi:two-component system NtrC family sensor kinase
MKHSLKAPASSLRNNIIIAFFLLILMWAVLTNVFIIELLQNAMNREGLDENSIKNISRHFMITWTGLTLVSCIIAFIIALLLSNTITRPMRKIMDGMLEIASGKWSARIDISGQDEMSRLAEGFNIMAEHTEKALQEIEEWNRELEKRVADKTRELKESELQLIQSAKLSTMGMLAAGLTHELNSPLTGLLPLLGKYRNQAERYSKEFNELTLMLRGCEHIARVIRNFGSFARESRGEPEDFTIDEIIKDTLSFSSGTLIERGIRIIEEYSDNLPKVRGDRTGLQQVVLNIITNARDSMPEGGRLIIKTGLSGDKKNITMQFTDNGIGIEKENLGRIFDPFYSSKPQYNGVGLGLSISYGIIQKHHGDISVKSKPGEETTFTVSIPVFSREGQITVNGDL